MGTVPDSLRSSAQVSLITTSSKEEVLGEVQLTHTHLDPALLEDNTNGLSSDPAKSVVSPRAATVALMQACEHEPTQPSMSSPAVFNEVERAPVTLSSPASPQLPAHGRSPALGPCCRAQSVHLNPEHTMPATNEHISQLNLGDEILAPVEPKVTQVQVQRMPGIETLGEPQDRCHDTPNSKYQACSEFPSQETIQKPVQVTETPAKLVDQGPISCPSEGIEKEQQQTFGDSLTRSCDSLSREHRCSASAESSDIASEPQVLTFKTLQPSHHADSSKFTPDHCSESGSADQQGSRFKEASTMTTHMESEFRALPSKALQDAGVQAVASMESRSVCTSPSILPAFLSHTPAQESFEPQEELCVIYHSGGGRNDVQELSDRGQATQKSNPGPGVLPSIPTQEAAAVSSVSQGESKGVSLPGEVLQTSSRQVSLPGAQEPGQKDNKSSGMRSAGEALTSQQPANEDSRSLQASPADQSSESANRQPETSHGMGKHDTKPCESAGLATNGHKPDPDFTLSKSRGSMSKVDLCGGLEPNTKEKQATPGRVQEESAAPSSLDGKAGPEAQSLLHHKSQESRGPGSVANPSPLRKNQEGPMEENRAAKTSTSLNLPPDCLGESSPSSGKRTPSRSVKASPRRSSRVSEFLKEQKLNMTAAAAQVGLTTGEKKKQLGADSKLHLKQSKRVRDVVWDEQGMTWEVYGASLDPESLGLAIQNHLQRQIREHEKLIKAQSGQSRRSISSDTSSNKKLKGRQHGVFQSMLQNLRRPNCCVRPAPSSVLD